MNGVTRFENLIAWQKARVLTRLVYCASTPEAFGRDYDLIRQIRSAAVSVMGNIAEGFERNRRAELLQFLSIAKASCGELRSHLYVALDAGYLQPSHFSKLKDSAEELSKIISGLHSAIRSPQRRLQ